MMLRWHFWWIDSFSMLPGFYRYRVRGFNDASGDTFFWTIPRIALRPGSVGGGRYVFRLREITC